MDPPDQPPPLELLGLFDHGSKIRKIFWGPFQGTLRRYPGRTYPPHNIQHGGRCGPPTLDNCGGSNGEDSRNQNRGFRMGHPKADGVFLCQKQTPGIKTLTLATSVVRHPDRAV